MSKNIFIIGLIIVVVVVLVLSFNGSDSGDEVAKVDDGTSMPVPAPGSEGVEEVMVNDDGKMMEDSDSMINYQGGILAGSSAKLLDFTRADYEAAKKTDKLIALYFYAKWCPICRAEFPKMAAAFDKLETDEVIGFRVNFNDGDTDEYEEGLASEFGVAYQHTKVFVRNGERVLKSPEGWEESRYLREINTFLTN